MSDALDTEVSARRGFLRRLVVFAGSAGVAGFLLNRVVGTGVLPPVQAGGGTSGGALIIDAQGTNSNTGTGTTQLNSSGTPALIAANTGNGAALEGSCTAGTGVYGTTTIGTGVQGEASAATGVAVQGFAGDPGAIPIVATGAPSQTANLQEWRGSSGPLSVVDKNGNLGVGTASPGFMIHAVNPSADGALTLECYSSVGPIPRVNTRTSRGTPTSPSASQAGDRLFQLSGYGRGATGFSSLGSIALIGWCAENFTDTTQGAYLAFWTTPIGSPSTARAERMRVDSNGNVGIGITTPAQKLDVAGNIHLSGTVMTGDIEFKNGLRATEDGNGLAFKNDAGEKIALLDCQGNWHIKGKIIQDL